MRWGPLAAATGLGLAILVGSEILTDRLTPATLTTLLRLAAVCVALGVAFLLDDPAASSTQTAPMSRLIRHTVRAGIALSATASAWAAVLVVTAAAAGVPRRALTLETAALVAVALALAAGGLRFTTDASAGIFAAPTLLLLVAIGWFLPRRAALILAPGDPHWAAAHDRWTGVLATAVVIFIWAGREPATRPTAVKEIV